MIELNEQEDGQNEENEKNFQIDLIDYNTLEPLNLKDLENQLECNCRMNQSFFNTNKEVSYICRSCPNKMKNLCRFCIEVCHKNHRLTKQIDQLRDDYVSFLNNPCSCALSNHKVSQFTKFIDKQDSNKNRETKVYCHFNGIFSLIKPKYYYKKKENNKIYCLFCIHNKNEDDGMMTKEITSDDFDENYEKCVYSSSYPFCSCENSMHKHEMPIENINNLIGMFSDLHQTSRMNIIKMSCQFFASKDLHDSFITEYIFIQSSILDNENQDKKKDDLIEKLVSNPEKPKLKLEDKMDWDLYFKSDQLLNIASKQLKNLNCNYLNEEISPYYSYKNMIFLLSAQCNLPFNLIKIQKANCSIFRRFHVNNYSSSDFLFPNINISPLHRLLLSPVKDEEHLSQIQKVIELLFENLSEMEDYKKIPQSDMNGMFLETLKLIKSIIVFYSSNKEELLKLFNQIESLMFLFKEKKEGQGKVLKTLQKIIEIILTYLNDIAIYERFINPKDKENEKDSNIHDHMQYCFQNNDINKSLIKTLFTFDGAINEDIEYLESKSFYDNLINENDFYIESVKSIINSPHMEKMMENDPDYIELIKGNISSLYKMNNHLTNDIKEIDSIYKGLSSITLDMLNNVIDEMDFLKNLNEKFDELHHNLQNGIFNEYIKKNQFKCQLLFFKLGYFAKLKETIVLAQKIVLFLKSNNDDQPQELKDISGMYNKLLLKFKNILLLLIQDNPFVAGILLTKENIKLILDKQINNMDLFISIGKLSKEYEYLFNFDELIKYIHYNFQSNFNVLKNNFEQNESIFKMYKIILDQSTNKSVLMANNIIATHLAGILELMEFKQILNSNNFDENDKQIIKSVLTCVIHLKKEYFYLVNPSINIEAIMTNLDNMKISPPLRKVLFKVYSAFFLESYFSLVHPQKFYTNESTVPINLIDNANIYGNDKIKTQCSFIFKRKNKEVSIEETILLPVISNLERLKYYYLNHENSFKKSLKFLLSYFNDVVFLPTIYSIYKITYFSQDLTAQLKYNVYNIICLFIQCYKYILEDVEIKYDLNKKENEDAFKKYFTQPIKILLKIAKETFDKINSPQVQLLNLKLMINFFLDNIKSFKEYQNRFASQAGPEEAQRNPSNENDEEKAKTIFESLNEAYTDYLDKKGQYEEDNILNEIFSDENYADIQNKIALDLLLKLDFILPENKQIRPNNLRGSMKSQGFKALQLEAINRKEANNKKRESKSYSKNTFKGEFPKAIDMGDYQNEFINPYLEEKTVIIESVDRLFKTNPGEWQRIIISKVLYTKNIINILIEKQLPILIQFIFIEYNRIDSSTTHYYQSYLLFLEFLRLLCEDHNPIFQTMLINYEKAVRTEYEDSAFISFICRLPSLILHNTKHALIKADILKSIKHYDMEYFNPLIEKVTDFLIELIQGTYPDNFEDLTVAKDSSQRICFTEYYSKHHQFLDVLDSNSEYEFIMGQFIRFLNCFIEENSNPNKIKIPVIVKLNPKKLISSAINAFKKLIYKYVNETITVNCHKLLLDKFITSDPDLLEDPLFAISTGIFIYLKRVNSYKDKAIGDKFQSIIEDLNDLVDDKTITEENSTKLIHKEFFLFCNTLIKDSEISFTEDQSRDEKDIYNYKSFFSAKYKKNVLDLRNSNCNKKIKHDSVFFMVHPDSLFLEHHDTLLFLEKAEYTNFNTKLNCILKYFPEISTLIEMRKMFRNNGFLLFLYQIHYGKLEVYNAILSLVISILLVLSREGNIFQKIIVPVALLHLCFLGVIISNWFIFNTMTEVKYKQKSMSCKSLVKFFFSSMFDLEIFCFFWTLFWGIPAVLFKNLRFLFSLQLFAIFNLFPTMRSVLYAVQVRYKQFLSTAFLLVILILFYAAVTFYFFKAKDDGEELCSSYLECFLFLFNSGIRAGGVDFGVKIEEHAGFWSEFIFSWVFYFIIILIILNIVNGIIVDTFQALREQNNEIDEEKSNVCFVCSLHRSNFEIKGIDFEHHINHEHNITNYFKYLLKVLRTDEHDLNSIDFQVFNLIKSNKIEFFPIKKAKSLEEVN